MCSLCKEGSSLNSQNLMNLVFSWKQHATVLFPTFYLHSINFVQSTLLKSQVIQIVQMVPWSFLVIAEHAVFRSSHPEVFLWKGVLKICSKFTGEHPCQSAISIKFQIALRYGCSPVNLLHIFTTSFPKNTSGRLLLSFNNSDILFLCIMQMRIVKSYH